jgi:hypothetical protein
MYVRRTLLAVGLIIGCLTVATAGAYWWANIPPRRPASVSANAVFLWAGHMGLPAPKHGTWIECWADTENGVNKCRLTEMNGKPSYEGIFVSDTGQQLLSESDLKIKADPTSNSNHWLLVDRQNAAPLVFLESGSVLIPKDGYTQGKEKLNNLRQVQDR